MNEMIYAAMDFWKNAPQVQVLGLSIHLYLLIAAIICATPLSHNLMERFRGLCRRVLDVHTAYSLDRVIKTVIVLILLAISTVRLAGDSYNPFIYFIF